MTLILQGCVFIGTANQEVLCCPSDYDISEITPCTHEEADVRMPLHTLHASSQGHSDIFWRTADTDVVVLGTKLLAEQEETLADIVVGFGVNNPRSKRAGMRQDIFLMIKSSINQLRCNYSATL